MRILTNGFPTNLPDSETISQGGPANFARLFLNHIIASHLDHQWAGVVMERNPHVCDIKRIFTSNYRRYFRLDVTAQSLRDITKAARASDPEHILAKPINLLVKLMQEEKPDVVFLNGFGVLNWMLLKAAEKTGIPVVIQHAGIWTKELAVHEDLYSAHGRAMMEQMEKDSTRIAAVEIFLNRWSRDYYRLHVAAGDLRKTEVVPLPFDFSMFRALSAQKDTSLFRFKKNEKHIGIIARWDDIKNHDAIVAIAQEARKRNLPWRFHAVVEIPEKLQSSKKAREYKEYVTVVDPLNRTGVSDFCRSVDMLFLPSLFDVSPTVVLEAIALDTPIAISPNVGYVQDFLETGAEEWVIDVSDIEQATNALSCIMGREMPDALKKRLFEIHDHRKVFARYLELFAGANVRGLPFKEVFPILWKQEMQRMFAR